MSKESIKRGKGRLDFEKDEITILGETLPLNVCTSGHYSVSLLPDETQYSGSKIQNVLFTSPIKGTNGNEEKKKVLKLHKQFAHPNPEKLKTLIRNSGVHDKVIETLVDEVSQNCDVCKRFMKPAPRPVVGFPLASEFNDTVAMDLKMINQRLILHMIDHATRYSMASLVPNKKPETIVQAVMSHWIRVFGTPKKFLTDNGGEFVNSLLTDLADKMNINLKTTAAESAWSNGICERHNAVIADLVYKIQADVKCSLELAIPWAIAAKNALTNVYGFSPNQLVFGKNINFPAVYTDKLPAENSADTNQLILRHLRALHSARQAFIAQESCEKLRRALNKQTRTFSNVTYQNGDSVYYKRQNRQSWQGPAKVLGKDGFQFLLKHGGVYIRVHPCKMQLVEPQDQEDETPKIATTDRENDTLTQKVNTDIEMSTPDREDEAPEDEDHFNYGIRNQDMENDESEDPVEMNNPQEGRKESTPRAIARLADYNKPPDKSVNMKTKEECNTVENLARSVENKTTEEADEKFIKATKSIYLPKVHSTIQYRKEGDSTWHKAEIVSKAGKSTTGNWHFMNIKYPGEDDAKCVSMKNVEWKLADLPTEPEEEVFFGDSTCLTKFDIAKRQEIEKWKEMNVFSEVEDFGQDRLSTKWVCTEKTKGNQVVLKARLVIRGFEEDSSQLKSDSPTCSKDSLRILLGIIAAKKWTLNSIDIKSAYLQGNTISRELYVKPPSCEKTTKLWKLNKTPYGLVDAGRQWFIRVKKEFNEIGARQSKCDPAVFIWENPTKKGVAGILIAHVDDFLFGGNQYFLSTVVPKIKSIFTIGLEESSNLTYLGLQISQEQQGIKLSTNKYVENLREVDIVKLGPDKSRTLNSDEINILRAISGQINWTATQSRPDIAFDNCQIGNSTKNASVSNLLQANKTIRKLKSHELSLFFPSLLDLKTCELVAFCDASFANLPDRGSQGGYIIFLVDVNGNYCPITWQSKKIKRMVNSTLGAECLIAVEASEHCTLLKTIIQEMLCLDTDETINISIISDNKSLVDAAHTSTTIENKRLQIDVGILREMITNGEIHQFRWIDTKYQAANALTKNGCPLDYLLKVLKGWLKYDFQNSMFL